MSDLRQRMIQDLERQGVPIIEAPKPKMGFGKLHGVHPRSCQCSRCCVS